MKELVGSLREVWVFGYGSLIWRPSFRFVDSRIAIVSDFQRRFCQASHDHRGTPESPGRVVTLAPASNDACSGVAFKLGLDASEILRLLDIREQDGYERVTLPLMFDDGSSVQGTTWIANEGNPSWRVGETLLELAILIASSEGPSGSNREYLYELERALDDKGIPDKYVSDLSELVRSLR